MNDLEYIKKIEELNLEIIKLKSSKEYSTGKKVIEIEKYLKNLQIKKIIDKIQESKNIKKYSNKEEDNNYCNVEKICKTKPRIAVYTCITGNYDKKILEPYIKVDNIDFYLFTDNVKYKSENWIIKPIPKQIDENYNNILKNRYIKMHPYELFKEYDYSVYIDGNVQVMSDLTELVFSVSDKIGIAMHRHQFRECICDEIEVCKIKKKGNYSKMKKQVKEYIDEGFPKKFGMLEATIIVTQLKNEVAKSFLAEWWNEFVLSESLRDQISLQYVVWKNKFKINDIAVLGNNLYRNPKFRVNIH